MTKDKTETRTVEIKASMELWSAFNKWAERMSCLTLPEGLRAAMREVTGFSGQAISESDVKSED